MADKNQVDPSSVYLKRLLGPQIGPVLPQVDVAKIEKALARAHQVRDFEITLYWTRSSYFWGFQVVFFAAFGLLGQGLAATISTENPAGAITTFLLVAMASIAAIATLCSYLWGQMLNGAKFWQDNWERHIDILEDYVHGPLYKTYFVPDTELRANPRFRPVSVTKVNKVITNLTVLLWALITALTGGCIISLRPDLIENFSNQSLIIAFFVFVGLLAVCWLMLPGKISMKNIGVVSSSFPETTHQIVQRESLKVYD